MYVDFKVFGDAEFESEVIFDPCVSDFCPSAPLHQTRA